MKKIISILTALLILTCTFGCGQKTYRDDLSAKELANGILDALDDGKVYTEDTSGYLASYFSMPENVTEQSVFYSAEAGDLNEIGVFCVQDGKTDALVSSLKAFLKQNLSDNEAYYNSYIPEEIPKLRDGEVRVYGNYVVYLILNKSDRATADGAIEALLEA